MPDRAPDPNEVLALRKLVEEFIEERLKPKLEEVDKKLAQAKNPEEAEKLQKKREDLCGAYRRGPWLASAAQRVGQIQYVTHAVKFSHPNAQGSSLCAAPSDLARQEPLVGTACLANELTGDVVGNAAALDVYKFLKLEHQGRSLLERVTARDPALAAALDDDPGQGAALLAGLAAITGAQETPASHTLARQVYFPLPEGGYHLLAPLFPTSLVHALYTRLSEARFSEEAKAARLAKKKEASHPTGYSDYPNLAVQVFGGSKPQNVSQLNSERHGEAWLLPSLPPNWQSPPVRPPLGVASVFRRVFGGRPEVRELVSDLARFLASTDYNNLAIRQARAARVARLCDHLVQFAAELQDLEPGWSADPACRLPPEEALWLDPGRAAEEPEFAARRADEAWRDEVARRFANWLNHELERRQKGPVRLHLGADEAVAWKKEALKVL